MTLRILVLAGSLLAMAPARAQENFSPDQVKLGSNTYARHCAPCHGSRMKDPEGAFDLRTFPRDQRERFVTAVLKGLKAMPPWEGLLKPEEIDALWAYVAAGERN